MRGTTAHWFESFVCQPKRPSSGHSAFPACFGKCRSSTSLRSWRSDRARGTALCPLSSPAGTLRSTQEGRQREVYSPTLIEPTVPPAWLSSSWALPAQGSQAWRGDRRVRMQQVPGPRGISQPHGKGILPFTDRESEAQHGSGTH